jgi:hypothetical protein
VRNKLLSCAVVTCCLLALFLLLGVVACGEDANPVLTPITEQQILELAAPEWGVAASELQVEVSEDFGEWSAAVISDPQIATGAVYQWTGSRWVLFWLQDTTLDPDGNPAWEDTQILIERGVPQEVVDWLNLDM